MERELDRRLDAAEQRLERLRERAPPSAIAPAVEAHRRTLSTDDVDGALAALTGFERVLDRIETAIAYARFGRAVRAARLGGDLPLLLTDPTIHADVTEVHGKLAIEAAADVDRRGAMRDARQLVEDVDALGARVEELSEGAEEIPYAPVRVALAIPLESLRREAAGIARDLSAEMRELAADPAAAERWAATRLAYNERVGELLSTTALVAPPTAALVQGGAERAVRRVALALRAVASPHATPAARRRAAASAAADLFTTSFPELRERLGQAAIESFVRRESVA